MAEWFSPFELQASTTSGRPADLAALTQRFQVIRCLLIVFIQTNKRTYLVKLWARVFSSEPTQRTTAFPADNERITRRMRELARRLLSEIIAMAPRESASSNRIRLLSELSTSAPLTFETDFSVSRRVSVKSLWNKQR